MEHEKYDSSIKVLRDNIVVYQAAVREGEIKGEAKGRAEGHAEGRTEEKYSIARSLKQMGLADSDIAKATGLTQQEITAL